MERAPLRDTVGDEEALDIGTPDEA